MKNIFIIFFLIFSSLASAQARLIEEPYHTKQDSTQPVRIFDEGIKKDTLYRVSFSYTCNKGRLFVQTGYLIQQFKVFYKDKQKFLVHDDYYVMGDDNKMYYLNAILLNNQVIHSKRIIEVRSLLFPKKPKIIWEIKIVN